MKTPRDISGYELSKRLSKLGYHISRQTGSHIRLTSTIEGTHHITIPAHNPIKIGTLTSIINDIANHFEKSKEEILNILF